MLTQLKLEILRRDLSQVEVARGSGIAPSRLSRLIRGRLKARAHDRRLIAAFLGVPQRRLFPDAWRPTRVRPQS
jgi:transcriptional regulator with XRE-family HTH domain